MTAVMSMIFLLHAEAMQRVVAGCCEVGDVGVQRRSYM